MPAPFHSPDDTMTGAARVQADREAGTPAQKAGAYFRSYGHGTEDWSWELDLDGRITYVSDNVVRVLGYAPAEILGRIPFEFAPPEEAARLASIFSEAKAAVVPFAALEQVAVHRDGHCVVLESCAMPVLDADGRLCAYRGLSRDITELKRAQQSLSDSERRLREAQRIAQLGHYTLWVANGFWESSEELDRIFGIGPDYPRNVESWLRIILPEDSEMMQRHLMEHVLRDGKPFDHEYRIIRQSDGRQRWVHGLGRLVGEAGTGAVLMVGTIQDITERKTTEIALAESESRYRFVSESMNEGVWDWDTATNRVFFSESCSKMFGYIPGELAADFDQWLGLIEESGRARLTEQAKACVEGKNDAFAVECRIRNKESEWRLIMVRGKAVARAKSGAATRMVGTLADISERRLLEDQLRQAQKLEAVGQLAGGIAHDFNNILASMTLQLDLMSLPIADSNTVKEGMQEIRKAALRAAGLTRQLLMFSRRAVPQMRSLDLNLVVAELMKMLSRLIGENVELCLKEGPALPHIEADAGMVEQVLMNLVVNARDAMPRGGRLSILTDTIKLTEVTPSVPGKALGTYVRLIVEDTGSGMSEEVKKHLFEPFYTTKEVGRGTGLGLAMIHGILTQHRGWIEVESEVGRGSRFTVYWPAAAAKAVTQRGENIKGRLPRGRETILLVEDEQAVRRNVSRCLQQLGYTVIEAVNGLEALRTWASARIDLLFTDMLMPEGMSGAELAAILRQKQPDLRVVISSGYSNVQQEGGACVDGAMYLPKPYEQHELAETVRRCLDTPV